MKRESRFRVGFGLASSLLDVPNADFFGFHPVCDSLDKLCKMIGRAVFFEERRAVVVGFVKQHGMRLVRHRANIELMTPGFEFFGVFGLRVNGGQELVKVRRFNPENNADCAGCLGHLNDSFKEVEEEVSGTCSQTCSISLIEVATTLVAVTQLELRKS